MQEKKFGRDLTVGSVPKHLWNFAIPMLIGNMLQSGYSIINMVWVGNIVGENGLGATAVSFPIMFILMGLGAGISMSTAVLVAQFYGAKNNTRLKAVIDNSFGMGAILSLALTVVGIASSDILLRMMDTPPEIFAMSSSYLKISLAGTLFLFLMFTFSSMLRGMGDTVTPLMFMGGGVILNAILDPLMIIGIGPFPKMGLNGAALASVISQIFSLTFALIYLRRKNHLISVRLWGFKFDRHIMWLIAKIGFPATIQQCLVSVGAAFVTSYVNFFGASAIAAFGAASRIDMVAMMPALAIGMAATALTGQKLGARKPERIKEIFKWAFLLGTALSGVVAIFAFTFPRLILSVFIHHDPVLDIGTEYLRIVGPCYLMFALIFVSSGVVNGAGQTMIPMLVTLLSLWAVRVPLAWFLSQRTPLRTRGIWLAMALGFVVTGAVNYLYYLSGRWKKSAAKIQSPPIDEPVLEASSL